VTDALRLVFGTLTVLPVAPPRAGDRRTAGRAMVLAPLVGLVLALLCVALLVLTAGGPVLLRAALCVALLALLTRGLHLDGLADTADGLGSRAEPERALELMRRGDVGPFGVVSLVLALLVQVAALESLVAHGQAAGALTVALVGSRASLPLLCSRAFPPARSDGLGSAVAGTVGGGGLVCAAALALAGLTLAGTGYAHLPRPGWVGDGLTGVGAWTDPAGLVLAVVLGLVAAVLLGRHCVHRLRGVTGDVLGAGVEVSFTVCLVVLALV
jgi:adenosylcobinamide-GDP ribazoletransferase